LNLKQFSKCAVLSSHVREDLRPNHSGALTMLVTKADKTRIKKMTYEDKSKEDGHEIKLEET
jgi:hypothetical protein